MLEANMLSDFSSRKRPLPKFLNPNPPLEYRPELAGQ
jgi:hypothetical protein